MKFKFIKQHWSKLGARNQSHADSITFKEQAKLSQGRYFLSTSFFFIMLWHVNCSKFLFRNLFMDWFNREKTSRIKSSLLVLIFFLPLVFNFFLSLVRIILDSKIYLYSATEFEKSTLADTEMSQVQILNLKKILLDKENNFAILSYYAHMSFLL